VILEQRGKQVLRAILVRLDQQVLPELWEIQALSVNRELPGSTVLTEDEELPDKEVLLDQPVLLVLLVLQESQVQLELEEQDLRVLHKQELRGLLV